MIIPFQKGRKHVISPPFFFFLLRRFLCSSFSRIRKIYQEFADMETRGKFTAAPRLPFGENRHINIKGDRRRLRLPSKPRKRKKLRLQWRREAPRCTTIRKKDPFLLLLGRQKFVPTCVCLSLFFEGKQIDSRTLLSIFRVSSFFKVKKGGGEDCFNFYSIFKFPSTYTPRLPPL